MASTKEEDMLEARTHDWLRPMWGRKTTEGLYMKNKGLAQDGIQRDLGHVTKVDDDPHEMGH
ncbi:hypothetical protein HPP92_000812 [Vanilla planifolia]|uniref:Uncharacterized protein n=1 Tax=Vanilla planifolia TaxID=51239 RepID=A0A835VGZ6_VANPL|nr:hypothetical protein HPP92_000812 [Vanilla planifolia]